MSEDIDSLPVHEQAQRGAFDEEDAREGKSTLENGLGLGYQAEIELARRGLKTLSPEKRRELFTRREADGRLEINSPLTIRELAQRAKEAPPSLLEATAKHGGDEKAAILEMMKDRNSPYWDKKTGPAIQGRYRDILSKGKA